MAASLVPSVSCAICRESFTEAAETLVIACGHLFHGRCIGEWLKRSPTCPQCRRQLRNPQKETARVYLSFGSVGEDPTAEGGDEPSGLAELRQELAAARQENEEAKKRLKRKERREAQMRRDLSQRQCQIDLCSMELETCKVSIAQQETENTQLMQLLAVESDRAESELQQLRSQLDAERLARDSLAERLRELANQREDLRSRLEASQLEVELLTDALQSERDAVSSGTDEFLAREAESLQLCRRLTAGHAQNSLLAGRLSRSQRRVAELGEQLLLLRSGGSCEQHLQFASLPVPRPITEAAPGSDGHKTGVA